MTVPTRAFYNSARPHSKLGWQTPDEFPLTFHTRRALALSNAKSHAPAPAASTAQQGKLNAGNELKTGQILGATSRPPSSFC
ncbi:transposase [Aminobacter sp. AP02]|uniref:transposase n=1 Tax=Aminobacter sp. AP02 TaxID=2135737 RepID=UPI0011B2890A|nr:transposase [Aminobacter sp. AP02]